MPAPQHQSQQTSHVACAVLTISDTRTHHSDTGGQHILAALRASGHEIYAYEILRDEPARIEKRLRELCDDESCRAVLLSGGTGIAPRDQTYEAVAAVLQKSLDGFGEILRTLSYEQVGSAAMLSRAVAGVCNGTAVFAMPGSPKAIELAMSKLILPELPHIAHLLEPS